jgi:S-formylglutathione hydrolase
LKTFSHWSNLRKRNVTFHFYSPDEEDLYPLVYIVPHNNSEEGAQQVLEKSAFQEWAYRYKLAVVIPDVTHTAPNMEDANCEDLNCKSHMERRELASSYEYFRSELDYLISENTPVIKGRQSIFGIGKGSWLALACALNNPKNYDSASILLNEQYSSSKN